MQAVRPQPLGILFVLLLAVAPSFAHGGVFRPPPRGRPRDPARTPVGPSAVTAPSNGSAAAYRNWDSWWYQNREPYLRLRERVLSRTVLTGTKKRTDLFDREALRRNVLLPLMLEGIKSPLEEIRTSAAVAIGKFGGRDLGPVLLKVLRRDRIRQVRESAMIGLMLLRDPALRDTMRDIALDQGEKRRIRNFALIGLGFLKDTAFLTRVATRKGVHVIGTASEIEELRQSATLGLGFTGSHAAVPPLLRLATDRNAPRGVRGYAGSAIARLGDPLAVSEMLDLLRDTNAKREARYGAAIAVGALVRAEETDLIDFLGKKAQRDKDAGLRALLTMSLGRIGGERAATHIAANLGTCQAQLKGFGYLALGLSQSRDAGPILVEEFGKAKSPNLRAACAIGLGLANYRKAAPMLREQLEKGNIGYVGHGMVALGLLDDAKSIPAVQALLKRKREPGIRVEGATALTLLRRAGAIPDLVAMLEDSKSIYTRAGLAAALGRVGDDNAVQPLLDLYRDRRREPEERAVALAALGRIGDEEKIALLAQLAFDLNPYVNSDAIFEALTIL